MKCFIRRSLFARLRVFAFGVCLACLLALGGCGAPGYDSAHSPKLIGYDISSYNLGSLEEQFVQLTLQFDAPVEPAGSPADCLRITIAGERWQAEDCEWTAGGSEAEVALTLRVNAVTNGRLEISPLTEGEAPAGLTGADGQYAAAPFTLSALIPSGVELETVDEAAGTDDTPPRTVAEVEGRWAIRSITWVQLWENGQVVAPAEQDTLEVLDGAVAVHGHDFLTASEEFVAQDSRDVLEYFFGDDYVFSAEGRRITAEKRSPAPGATLELRVYQYSDFACPATGGGRDENSGRAA